MNILWLYHDPVFTILLFVIVILLGYVAYYFRKDFLKSLATIRHGFSQHTPEIRQKPLQPKKLHQSEHLLQELNTHAGIGTGNSEAKKVFGQFQKVYKNTGGTVVIPSGNNPYEKDADLVLQVNINKSPYIFHRSRLTQIWEIKPPEIPSF